MTTNDALIDLRRRSSFRSNEMTGESSSADHPLVENEQDAQQETMQSRFMSYVRGGDFFEFVVVAVFSFTIAFVLGATVSPHERPIPFQELQNSGDTAYNQVNAEELVNETVSDTLLVILALIVPFVFQLILTKVLYVQGDFHATMCVYILAFGLTSFVTEFVKNYAGYLRPNFYDLCVPNDDLDACTSEDEDEGRKSFPSGHASLSFMGMTLLTLYLQRRFGVANNIMEPTKPQRRMQRLYSVVCLSPMLLAVFIAASRVHDNFHFPADVVGGAVIGFGLAHFSHGLWFLPWPTPQQQL